MISFSRALLFNVNGVVSYQDVKFLSIQNIYKNYETGEPPGQGQFWSLGHNLNTNGRGPLGDATYQISRLYALWLQMRRSFKVFISRIYFSLCDLDMQRTQSI